MTEQIHRAKINKSNDRTNTQSEDKQVEWQNKFSLSFDLFIFALCICSVIWLVYLRSVYLVSHLTCLSSFCVFVLSFDLNRTNTQSEDKQVEWQNKYTERRKTSRMTDQIHRAKINKSMYLFCHSTCLSSLCVFVLSFDLFIFVLCICSVIRLVYLRSVYLFCHLTQNKYTERR
jgi:hypothetical protein